MSHRRIVCVALTAACLAALPALAAAPQAVVEKPVIDVGEVKRGDKVRVNFDVRNGGDAELEITEVKPSCGCTVADFDARIAAGAAGRVRAVLDTRSFTGAIAKAVTVFTNDPANPKIHLVIKAKIRQPVVARPGYARFMTVQGQATEASVQTVASPDRPELEVLAVKSPYPFLETSHARAEDGAWRIELRLDPDAPAGPLADYVVVRTDHPDQPEVKISVSGRIRPVIAVDPRVADFGRRELAGPLSKSLEVKNLGDAAVRLTEAVTDLAGLEASIEAVEEGRHYRIQLTLTTGLPKGAFEGLLTIRTSSARQPVVEVPLRGTIL